MKRYFQYIIVLVAGVISVSCAKEMSDKEILDSRVGNSEKLTVSYAVDGAEVKSLAFSHSAVRKDLEVIINNDNLCWDIESNRSWCTVVPEEHKGSGKVILEIAANEGFDPREEATLTFVAGEFRTSSINVNQSATAFILSQPYFIAPIAGGSYSINVTTMADVSWEVSGDSWLTVTKGTAVDKGEFIQTTITVTPEPNSSTSRFGAVTLDAGDETDKIYFWQFGTELDYDDDGNIFFDSGVEAALHLTAPAFMVDEVDVPSFASASVTENGDGTAAIDIVLEENYSDCSELRQADISLKLNNSSASTVAMPAIIQNYVPAHGLVTGKGLLTFAKAVNEGASTSDWERDGVVTVVQDIDMNGINGWEGIGTASKPFTGTFDGGGHTITNLKNTSSGLFNYCKGATIKDICLGNGSSIYNNDYFAEKAYFGGIVSKAESTTISGCSFSGNMDYAGTSDENEPVAYVGGVVGWADASSRIQNSKISGKLIISIPSSSDAILYAGGIAGVSEGSLSASENSGTISFSSGVGTAYLGGIEGSLASGASASNNSYMGSTTISGNSTRMHIGGLYGSLNGDRTFDNATDKSVSLGSIDIESFGSGSSTNLYVGGFAGKAEGGISLSFKDYEFQTNISIDQTVNREANFVLIGGVLGGCDPDEKVIWAEFESVSNTGTISTAYAGTSVTSSILHGFVGGIAGFVNGPATFITCTNNGEIGKITTDSATSGNTKHKVIVLGGIAGVVIGGDAVFAGCENKGKVTNNHYSNSIPGNTNGSWYSPCISAGILGAFDYLTTSVSGTLKMSDCANGGTLASYRGCTGGIVGFARNANISGCTNLGDMSISNSNAAFKGGIACWVTNTSISNCIAKCNIFCSNPASAVQSPGGIVSISLGGGVEILDCSWNGVLSVNKTDQPSSCGGIISTAESDTKINNSKIGGKINGVELSENNVSDYVSGNGLGNINGVSYWNGNL